MMKVKSRAAMLALTATWLLVGCKPDEAVKPAVEVGSGSSASAAVAPKPSPYQGSVTGEVLFAGKAPAPVEIDTSMDPACGFGGSGKVFSEQFAVHGGKLGNVFVYVKAGPDAAMKMGPVTAAPTVLDQRGCQYVPHVVGVMAGGLVEFRNSDRTMHNIHTMPTTVGNETVDVSQGPGTAPVQKRMGKPELMMPVRCNNHPWMNAFVNVSATPFFAVTGVDGKFTINGLPPGDYTLGFVQEKLGEKTAQVTVPASGAVKAGVTFGQ